MTPKEAISIIEQFYIKANINGLSGSDHVLFQNAVPILKKYIEDLETEKELSKEKQSQLIPINNGGHKDKIDK